MKILLVEDDVILASTMECILSEAGHEVVGLAREEQLAIRTAARTRPDLALVDFELARGPSGGEVARKLRENFEIPAVFVSGSPGDCHKVGIHVGVLGCLVNHTNGIGWNSRCDGRHIASERSGYCAIEPAPVLPLGGWKQTVAEEIFGRTPASATEPGLQL